LISDQVITTPPNGQQPKAVVLPSRFKVRLEMKSDWHVGTGAGRPGSVDKLLVRDARGFPFVPAKTVNGIWRDAMEKLTLGLDDGTEGAWSKWVGMTFGLQPNQISANELDQRLQNNEDTYSLSLLSMQPARLSENLSAKIEAANDPRVFNALTFIKPGVSIDDKTGTAITDFLRFEEMGRAGTVLEAECELNFEQVDAEAQNTISALLLLSAKLVERIGGKRRRGAGLCELRAFEINTDKDIDAQAAIEWLDKNRTAPDVPSPKVKDANVSLNKNATGDGWQTLEFSLELQVPVAIVTATLGNVSESLDFIPGTYLLPHITKIVRKKLGDEVFQAVAYGDLQVLSATIEVNNRRGLPVPRALAQQKVEGGFDKQGTLYNRFTKEKKTDKQLKPFRSGYVEALESVVVAKDKLPWYKTAPKTLLLHNTVEDSVQRPTRDVGGVYSREAIAAGTTLRGEIRLRKTLADELCSTSWWTDLNGSVRLGTSRKDDYGLAELKLKKDDKENTIAPKPFEPKSTIDPNNNKRLTVFLLSDCLLRNATLRQTNSIDELAKELGDKLGVTLDRIKPRDYETTSLVMTQRRESWHEGWGFPRSTLIAMEAGSCVVFEVDGDLTEDSMHKVEAAGIGERRGEGYGQVCFNPPLLTQAINGWEKAEEAVLSAPIRGPRGSLLDEEKKFAELIEETAWREELNVAVLKFADQLKNREAIFGFDSERNEPPMSQIGGLRSAISRLQEEKDKGVVISWLEHLKETPNRRDKWAKHKERADAKLKRIMRLLEPDSGKQKPADGPQNVWEWLQGLFNEPATLVRSKEELQKKLWADAVRSVFDACARAHKRDLEKPRKEK